MAYRCEFANCTNKAQVRGLCRRHYNEVRLIERAAENYERTQERLEGRSVDSTPGEGRFSAPIAYALWLVLGIFGGHRFYLHDFKRAVGMLVTAGGVGVWWFIDLFLVGGAVRKANSRQRPID